jgi:hypothetical protein
MDTIDSGGERHAPHFGKAWSFHSSLSLQFPPSMRPVHLRRSQRYPPLKQSRQEIRQQNDWISITEDEYYEFVSARNMARNHL